ncbi:hypothetical protein [Edaphosphingomonas haloaromaticamans]|uniref:Uncharacterized protein n=1 Tax=Edaphosphingomonas haloaromaticamans TaxID=653954 RepID=A0A1S1HG42_9SPHN|nr:hypothetical protein [Sphingomonas haloaromaticamans]OHT19500.1 hypothetical protein BHE75_01486 [Sphingomonas haloaromaticamans]
MQGTLWALAGASAAVAGLAALADHRRNRRRDVDRVGWVPWPLIVMLAILLALAFTTFAIHNPE